jgi:hypothetical protein
MRAKIITGVSEIWVSSANDAKLCAGFTVMYADGGIRNFILHFSRSREQESVSKLNRLRMRLINRIRSKETDHE